MDPIAPIAPPGPAAAVGVAQVPGSGPLDDTAEAPIDAVATLAETVSRRAEFFLLAAQSRQQEQQLRLDKMRANFNEAQERRAERLREMNALRDMTIEQSKKDDEILKKFIAMI